jgi:hypothetical protein
MEVFSEGIWVVPLASDLLLYICITVMIGIPTLSLLGYRLIKQINNS